MSDEDSEERVWMVRRKTGCFCRSILGEIMGQVIMLPVMKDTIHGLGM